METAHIEHDIFLLMLNLSQLKSPYRIRELFLEALNSFWKGVHLRFLPAQEHSAGMIVEIATIRHVYGSGIEPQYHDRIFHIFQTLSAHDTSESTGIGLALVKKIVESSGGTIWVESSPKHGSVFTFTLPKHGVSHYEK